MPTSLFWVRTDTAGSEHALLDDRNGLTARGQAQAVDPVPWTCRYTLSAAADWSTVRLEVEATGAGWSRGVRLERQPDRWRIVANEQGDLDAALRAVGRPPAGLPGTDDPARLADAVDVDLGGSPLFNTLPVRRLGLLDAAADSRRRIQVAWVLVPSLLVVPAEQTYTALGAGRVGFASDTFRTEIEVDADGYVTRYPGLADRVFPPRVGDPPGGVSG
ncbi:putative glycolipid-binding domain-containing protein [Micromonospora sp. WMMD882]|uniref:putative glycolipid-binding domain-containing protein n=1 Tax=Micromonospora sp. WMMD882 TaxID=3015151 RepID=UPI00248C788C|nr:putative glycolipid-binding domain-containing protein [Micromonospora sp. WMMD882]WBB82439.1 putative glycolipid-binding domain-containing protein [Micromonospora sp. WMMD882]